MKKRNLLALISVFVLGVILLSGCGNFSIGGGGVSDVTGAILLMPTTMYLDGTTSEYIDSYVASRSSIGHADPRYLEFPNGNRADYRALTGGQTVNHYYYGTSQEDHGSIIDPFFETQFRQLRISQEYSEPFDGQYYAKVADAEREFRINEENYLERINPGDIQTGAGGSLLNVTSGDTITVFNQSSSDLRYLCRIYDTNLGNGKIDKYWSSGDVTELRWYDTENLRSFFTYETTTPSGGQVQFRVPGSILNTGNDNLLIVIDAFDVAGMANETDGDLDYFFIENSQIKMYYSGI